MRGRSLLIAGAVALFACENASAPESDSAPAEASVAPASTSATPMSGESVVHQVQLESEGWMIPLGSCDERRRGSSGVRRIGHLRHASDVRASLRRDGRDGALSQRRGRRLALLCSIRPSFTVNAIPERNAPATSEMRTKVAGSGEWKRATGLVVEPRSGETRFAAQPRNAPATSEMRTKVAGSGEWKRATGLEPATFSLGS